MPRTLTSVIRVGELDGSRNRTHRALVEHDRASVGRVPNRLLVAKVRLNESNTGNVREVLELAVGEVVETDDLVPVRDEAAAQMGADESGGAGDESIFMSAPQLTRTLPVALLMGLR